MKIEKPITKNLPEMTNSKLLYHLSGIAGLIFLFTSCVPSLSDKAVSRPLPASYAEESQDTINTAKISWRQFFSDPYLTSLIDTALKHNQELNITLREIEITRNEVRVRKGEYLPFVGVKAGAGVDKTARYTPLGANEATTDISPGREMPEPVPDFLAGAFASWEVDIWNKLHNAKKAAVTRYLASVEGRNFMVTNLVAEIATSYYELLALDNQLEILQRNIGIQSNALKIVKLQKEATQVTELAVKRFEAQVLKTQSLKYQVQQQIIETENRINFLVGRYPQPVQRSAQGLEEMLPDSIFDGIPAQLLENRADIRQAELELKAADLDVEVARANFYPRLDLEAGIGLRAFDPAFLVRTPESMLYSLAGEITAPLINRNALKAAYYSANALQIQAVYNYQQRLLNAYIEVVNQLSKISNLGKSYELKTREVKALNESIAISNNLFKSARADYMEVLMTQRDALEAKFELIETKKEQMNAMVNAYQALGGGWN